MTVQAFVRNMRNPGWRRLYLVLAALWYAGVMAFFSIMLIKDPAVFLKEGPYFTFCLIALTDEEIECYGMVDRDMDVVFYKFYPSEGLYLDQLVTPYSVSETKGFIRIWLDDPANWWNTGHEEAESGVAEYLASLPWWERGRISEKTVWALIFGALLPIGVLIVFRLIRYVAEGFFPHKEPL